MTLTREKCLELARESGIFSVPYPCPERSEEVEALVRASVALGMEMAADKVGPKTNRPCDCLTCDCGNSGNLAAVTAWDSDFAMAQEIRKLAEEVQRG